MKNFKNYLSKSLSLFWKILGLSIIIIFLMWMGFLIGECKKMADEKEYVYTITRDYNELAYEAAKYNLLVGINDYIHYVSKYSALNSIAILQASEEYNISVKFILAQGHIESHFGTNGLASKTNSVFNVYSGDGKNYHDLKKEGKIYPHPDYSVMPYAKLIRENFLFDGRTEEMLLENFVDKNGKKYATAPNYEADLTKLYNKIDSIIDITTLCKEYHYRKNRAGKFF